MNSKRNILHYRMRGKISVLYEQNYDIIQFNNKLFSLDNGIQGGRNLLVLQAFVIPTWQVYFFPLIESLKSMRGQHSMEQSLTSIIKRFKCVRTIQLKES